MAQMAAPVVPSVLQKYNPYKALSWSHLGVPAGGHVTVDGLKQIPQPPFAEFPPLSAKPSAAEIARALLQQPFRAFFLGADLKT